MLNESRHSQKSRWIFPIHARGLPLFFFAQFAIFILQFAMPLALSATTPYHPVQPDPLLESWRWRSFPELKGLGLASMAEDVDGSMWFGLRDGARRYDGVNWKIFTEADGILGSPVLTLLGAQDGSVWAGTPEGISRFQDGKWRRIFPSEGGPMWPATDLMEASDGSVWAGTAWGALHFRPDGPVLVTSGEMAASVQELLPDLRVSVIPDVAVPVHLWPPSGVLSFKVYTNAGGRQGDPSVILSVASGGPGETAGLKAGDGIFPAVESKGAAETWTVQRGGSSFEVKLTPAQVAGGARVFQVHDIYEDREGMLWFGLWPGQIVRYDLREPEGETRLFELGWKPQATGPRILQTEDGTIWAVSSSAWGGISRFDGRDWTSFNLRDEGGTDMNPDIVQTRDGTVWVSGQGGRLHGYRKGRWTVYKNPEVPTPGIYNFLLEASDGALWIGGVGQEAVRFDLNTQRWRTYEGLRFACETPDGSQWFVSQDSSVVRYNGKAWTRYGTEDGLMDWPVGLLATRGGTLWAMGADDRIAATARFDGSRWVVEKHPGFALFVSPQACESLDGSLWFVNYTNPNPERGETGGVLRFDGKAWAHYLPPEAPVGTNIRGVAQTPDGTLWFACQGLVSFDGREWKTIREPEAVTGWVHDLTVTEDGHLWGATRQYGVFEYDGETWTFYGVQDGLADNLIYGVLQTSDGSVWASTAHGISRFDGRTWTPHALPKALYSSSRAVTRQSRDGAIWIQDIYSINEAVRYQPDADRPETEILVAAKEVSQPGNTTISWKGADPWKATPEAELEYAWRMDGGEWSSFSLATSKVFEQIPTGRHTFEVKARDRDFNEDSTPASVVFRVVPPVWQEPWFIAMVLLFTCAVGVQTTRVVRRDRGLRVANEALSSANHELFGLNRELEGQNRALESANRQIREATQRKSAFLASMSHEIRTPMNAIIGFTRLVRRRAENLAARQQENLDKVLQSADHLLNLINDILDLSKIEAGRMEVKAERFGVKEMVEACCASVSPLVQPGVALRCEIGNGVGEAHTDGGRLRQVVINLLSNALKFTEQGEVAVQVAQEGGDLVVAVSDTGIGIPTDKLEAIFEEFSQVEGSNQKQKGTGLGLAITKGWVGLLGGTIGVESEVGKGSVFTVSVPVQYERE